MKNQRINNWYTIIFDYTLMYSLIGLKKDFNGLSDIKKFKIVILESGKFRHN